MVTLATIGLFISLAFPLAISINKETRFVIPKNLLGYGVSLIAFSLIYTRYELPEQYNYLKWVQWIFFIIGAIMLAIYFKVIKNPIKDMNSHLSLIYSWKNYGAFELAFISPIFFENMPVGVYTFVSNPIINIGLQLLALFWIISLAIRIYRNWLNNK